MKKRISKLRGRVKLMLLCTFIGIMVLATTDDIDTEESNIDLITDPPKDIQSGVRAFRERLDDVFPEKDIDAQELYVNSIKDQEKFYNALKNDIPARCEEHRNYYLNYGERDPEMDDAVKKDIDAFINKTPILPNSIIENLELETYIGKGSFGTVSAYETKETKLSIAVKKVKNNREGSDVETQVKREVAFATMFHLQNPHLAPIMYGYTQDEDGDYLILMEKFDFDLLEYVEHTQKKFSPKKGAVKSQFNPKILDDVVVYAEKIEKALKESLITHNDIGIENILVKQEKDGGVRMVLTDFEWATFYGLQYIDHRPISLFEKTNDPKNILHHRLPINPFQKFAYVFRPLGPFSEDFYRTVVNRIQNNDQYALGIVLYQFYLERMIYNNSEVRSHVYQQIVPKIMDRGKFIQYFQQHLNFFKKDPTNFRDFLQTRCNGSQCQFNKIGRAKYIDFIKAGKIIWDALPYDVIDAFKNNVESFIQSRVVDLWNQFLLEESQFIFEN